MKLLGKINWSWWWVVSPIWITIALIAIIYIAAIAIAKVLAQIEFNKFKKKFESGDFKGANEIADKYIPKKKSRFASALEEAMKSHPYKSN
jgi:hypothetical protein